jgi:hypothetical protein
MKARRLTVIGLVSACALAGATMISSASALAAKTRPFITSFGSLSNPQGIAIDQANGDVYVADTGDHRIEKFDAMGNFLLAFGANVGGPGIDTCTSICEAGTPGSGPGQFTEAKFVAVDDSPGGEGDVYVGDTGDNLVSKFNSSGELVSTWGTGGQLKGSSTIEFLSLAGIAVDPAGQLLVSSTESRLFAFARAGTFAGESLLARETPSMGLALDAADDLFKVNGDTSVEKFDPSSKDIGQVTNSEPNREHASAITIEPVSGDLYVLNGLEGLINHYAFNGSGEVIEPEGIPCVPGPLGSFKGCAPSDSVGTSFAGGSGIAVSSATGDTYVSNPGKGQVYVYGRLTTLPVTSHASSLKNDSAMLNGSVNPEGLSFEDCHFEYGTDASYGHNVPCLQTPAQIGPGTAPVAVSAEIAGLSEGMTYHFRIVTSSPKGTFHGEDESFTTSTQPAIDGAGTTNLSSSDADLTAKINPDNGQTSYHFEYGTTTAYGASLPIPDAQIGEGARDVPVSQHVTGLSVSTTYHFRVVASNATGTVASPDHVWVYGTGGGGLPDNRAYEMVTPPQKNAALIGRVLFGIGPDVSEDGSRLILSSIQCFAGSESCTGDRQTIGEQYLFTRDSRGWVTTPLAPPATQFEANTSWLVSAEAGTELFSMPIPPSNADVFYIRRPDGSFVPVGPATPPSLGAIGPSEWGRETKVATSDLSHIVYQMSPLWPFDASSGNEANSVYEYAGTENAAPVLVAVSGGGGSTDLISQCGSVLGGSSNGAVPGEISTDGNTVYFTAGACPSGTGLNSGIPVPANAVYARVDKAEAVKISGRAPGECTSTSCQTSPAGAAQFAGASSDGSKAFFTSTQQLTDNASEDSENNLYEYDFANQDERKVVDVSAGDTSGHGPRVRGVVAISSDGSHVYFVAAGRLTDTANSQGQVALDGADNLYVYERDASHPNGYTAFVAVLPNGDEEEWVERVGNVTPDGRFLVFTSRGKLTSDDTADDGANQVFRYDAQTGGLLRISIGELGFDDNGNHSDGTPCVNPGFKCLADAKILAAENGFYHAGPARSDPTMSHDGAYVFFESPVGLTPQALNEVQIVTGESGRTADAENIYEWHAGHVYLISDGRDIAQYAAESSTVSLIGSDATGANVFFTTTDPLVAQDTDTQLDFYDARICSASAPCAPPSPPSAPCLGEACHGTPSASPQTPISPTATFNGQGNVIARALEPKSARAKKLARCSRGRTRVRGRCVKKKKAKKAKSKKGGK